MTYGGMLLRSNHVPVILHQLAQQSVSHNKLHHNWLAILNTPTRARLWCCLAHSHLSYQLSVSRS
jgi:hypothetical protein